MAFLLLQATTAAQEQKVQSKVEEWVEGGSADLKQAKERLEGLSGREGGSGSEERVRANMSNALARKLQKEVQNFQVGVLLGWVSLSFNDN